MKRTTRILALGLALLISGPLLADHSNWRQDRQHRSHGRHDASRHDHGRHGAWSRHDHRRNDRWDHRRHVRWDHRRHHRHGVNGWFYSAPWVAQGALYGYWPAGNIIVYRPYAPLPHRHRSW